MHRRADRKRRTALATALLAAALTGSATAAAADPPTEAHSWRSAFEQRQAVPLDDRMIVVLAAPSLAERMAAASAPLSPKRQREYVRRANALQVRLLGALRAQGIRIQRELVFTRTLNGFSARLGARALAALESAPGVAGVYPVRAVYPASLSARALERPELLGRHGVTLAGADGGGVTVAVLDTGIDRSHPALRGRVLWGVDVVDGDAHAQPEARPDDPTVVETHGTRVAGLVAGAGAPNNPIGVAPGARVLPIRVLGWRKTSDGYRSVGSGDLLLAGLERAVDPDGDGDVEDRADIALAALVEPYAVFQDSPESRAVAGAVALGTLVVAPAGNDGAAAAGSLGTIGAPGAAPAALAVGAADTRPAVSTSRLTIRIGSETAFSGEVPLLGGVPPSEPLELPARAPVAAGANGGGAVGLEVRDFVGDDGQSRVAGAAAVLPADGASLLPKVRNAAAAGARAVLVYGSTLPAGVLDSDEQSAIPVFAIPGDAGAAVAEALGAGREVSVVAERADPTANPGVDSAAGFSSEGPSAGASKPDLVAAGVGLAAPDAGPAGSEPRYAAVTGTSAAAAVAAGAAALVRELRPRLDAAELASVLVGSAQPLTASPEAVTAVGAGLVDVEAASRASLAVQPATLFFGRTTGDSVSSEQTIVVRNISGRRLDLSLGVVTDPGAAVPLAFGADPATTTLAPGKAISIRIVASTVGAATGPATLSGALVVEAAGAAAARVPWTLVIGEDAPPLISEASLSQAAFVPSRRAGAVLSFRAGMVADRADGAAIEPVGLLYAELETARGRSLGFVTRLRDLLPGRYAIRLTGRGADGRPLRPGRYVLKLRAWPVDASEGTGPATVVRIPFRILP
jgi:subtilisin family serine protease